MTPEIQKAIVSVCGGCTSNGDRCPDTGKACRAAKMFLAGAAHEREECTQVAEREEKAHAEFSREAEVVPGGIGFRLYHKHLQGRAVACTIKQAIRARGKL